MGNSASSAAGNSNNRSGQPDNLNSNSGSGDKGERTPSISPGPGNPHHSLRSKKRSLELPDLASIAASPYPYTTTPYLRGRSMQPESPPVQRSAAIAIPVSPPNPFDHYQDAAGIERVPRQTVILPSTTDVRRNFHRMHVSPPLPELTRERVQLHQERIEQMEREEREREYREREQREREQTEREEMELLEQQQQQHMRLRGRQHGTGSSRHQQQVKRIQKMYDRSHEPPTLPSFPTGPGFESSVAKKRRPKEVVKSSIPTLLKAKEKAPEEFKAPVEEEQVLEPVPVKIMWKGGGTEVILARAGDDDWKGRQPMQKDPPDSNIWALTIDLLPGTHHVRFLVDGIWRVADDLPAAVDDQGSLANYVTVPFAFVAPSAIASAASGGTATVTPPPALSALPKPFTTLASVHLQTTKYPVPGHSFWSADSSADGDDDDFSSRPPKIDIRNHPHASPAAVAYIQATWTDVFPPELMEASREEEAYLRASAGQYDGFSTRVTGFVPAPNIPPAPGLPRYLDKLILNSKVGEQKAPAVPGSNGSVAGGSSPRRGGRGDGDGQSGLVGGVGSGQGGGKRERRDREDRREREERREREREERKERERSERERERNERAMRARRGNLPPAPPPSETGEDDDDFGRPGPYMAAQLLKQYYGASNSAAANVQANLGGSSSLPTGTSIGPAGNPSTSSSGNTIVGQRGVVGGVVGGVSGTSKMESGATTPQQNSGGPATPTGPMSPNQTPPTIAPHWGYVGTRTTGGMISPPPAQPMPPTPQHTGRAPISGSRAITIDDANMPPLTDDNSVLPVPSHVVLHHLCTSAIRNGVLAVANTTRYRKKYLTTIYCKPT